MNPLRFYRSTIGKKVIMAATGLIGVVFLLAHVAGNLQIFQGEERFNTYARFLHGPAADVVFVQRALLIVALVLHVLMMWQLGARNRAARPHGYRTRVSQVSTVASRTMRIGGYFLLAFIIFHILHFTTLDIDPTFVEYDVFGNVIKAFQHPWRVAVYTVAMLFLGLHLYHGLWSSRRTLGVTPPSGWPLRRRVAAALAIAIAVGFAIVPLAVFFGWVHT